MTGLGQLLTDRSRSQYRFVCYGEDEGGVVEHFATRGVVVDTEALPAGGPEPFVVIEEGGEFRGALALADLETLLEPPVLGLERTEGVSSGYRVLFDVLEDAVFTAMERRELLAVSREIEERAFRIGTGTLRAGFQQLSTFETQIDVYRALGSQDDLDVHVYGAPDWTPPTIPGVTYHDYTEESIERYWVLAYDSEASEAETCALVARETADAYDSFWTADPETTRSVLAELEGA